jgi:xanthine dehydrogenase accessory factor
MSELEIYEEMARLTRQGEPFCLATVIDHGGSSPRKAGAKMLLRSDGSTLGTIGGGRVEKDTMAAARQALDDGEPRRLEFVLNEENGFACGGRMGIFVERSGRRPLLVMFGAGHVGRAVTRLAHGCGFRVIVVDDRPEWAVHDLLPGADRVVCAGAGEAFRELPLDRESFVVIATPGHVSDFAAVRGCLGTDAGFIGLLGSRRKRETLLATLEQEGFDSAQRVRIVTPVGLAIGAETPEEIAVSIVGQLVAVRKGK